MTPRVPGKDHLKPDSANSDIREILAYVYKASPINWSYIRV